MLQTFGTLATAILALIFIANSAFMLISLTHIRVSCRTGAFKREHDTLQAHLRSVTRSPHGFAVFSCSHLRYGASA